MKCFYSETELNGYRKVGERYSKWMEDHWYSGAKAKFEWTEENVRRLLALNDAIMQKENKLYELFVNVNRDIEKLIVEGHSYYENYDIEATLSYEADDYSTPIADENTMFDVYCCTNFDSCTRLYTSKDRPLEPRDKMLGRDMNWNHDMFRTLPDRSLYICRFLHILAEEGTYTMEDFLYLNPDNFVECIEIRN